MLTGYAMATRLPGGEIRGIDAKLPREHEELPIGGDHVSDIASTEVPVARRRRPSGLAPVQLAAITRGCEVGGRAIRVAREPRPASGDVRAGAQGLA